MMRRRWRFLGVLATAVITASGLAASRPLTHAQADVQIWVGNVDFVYTAASAANEDIQGNVTWTFRADGTTYLYADFTWRYDSCAPLSVSEHYFWSGTGDGNVPYGNPFTAAPPTVGAPYEYPLSSHLTGFGVDSCSPVPDFQRGLFWSMEGPSGTSYSGSGVLQGSVANSAASLGVGTLTWNLSLAPPDSDLRLTNMPANISVQGPSDGSGVSVTYPLPTAIDEAGDTTVATVTCSPSSGSVFPNVFSFGQVTLVTCTAFDPDDTPSGYSLSFTVTVTPAAADTDLVWTGVPNNITTAATDGSGAVVSYSPPTATDEEGPPAVVCDHPSGSAFPVGTTTVNCSATDTDDTPSTVSASFTVTVTDTDLVLTGVPSNITTAATGGNGAVVTYSPPTATDEEGSPEVVCDHPSGSTFPVGTTTVNCSATDTDDTPSTVSASFTVTVTDTDLVLTGVPSNITTAATSGDGAVVNYTPPTATDEEGPPAVTCSPASGSTFPVGTTIVTCTATIDDDTPNSVSATFTVTVNPLNAQDVKLTIETLAPFRSRQPAAYAVVITNTGRVPTSGTLTFNTTLPAGLSYSGAFSLGGWQCKATGQAVTCTFNRSLPVGGATFFLLIVRVSAPAGTVLTDQATVTPLDATPDDNAVTVAVTVRP